MSTPLLTLGSFSFMGLESPELVLLRAKQRLAVHHLGSGSSIIDSLGEDYETASFRGIFSGTNAAARIRSLEYLRQLGAPLPLAWGSRSFLVIIQEFELSYSSNQWVPYKLTCRVVRTIGPLYTASPDVASATADAQVGDLLALLQSAGLTPASGQISALLELAALDFDTASADALQQGTDLLVSIDNQIAISLPSGTSGAPGSYGATNWLSGVVADAGQQAVLGLARNRLTSITVTATCVNQQ